MKEINNIVTNIIGSNNTYKPVGERCVKCKKLYTQYTMSGLCPSCKKKDKLKKDKKSKNKFNVLPSQQPTQGPKDKIKGMGNEQLHNWQKNMRNVI